MKYYFAGYILFEPYTEFDNYELENEYKIHPNYSINTKKEYYIWNEYDKVLPGTWVWDWTSPEITLTENIKKRFALSAESFKSLQEYSNELLHNNKLIAPLLNMPIFIDLEDAKGMYNKYFKKKNVQDIKLFGIYLPEIFIDSLIKSDNCYLIEIIKQKILFKESTRFIGYDLINAIEFGLNLRQHHFGSVEHINFKVNEYGLIDTFDDALKLRNDANYGKFQYTTCYIEKSTGKKTYGDINIDNWVVWAFEDIPLH